MPYRWDSCADLRREQIESGLDLTYTKVFLPWYVEFVQGQGARTVLEAEAGTGHLARALSSLVAEYVAIEPSDGMHKVAADVLINSPVILRKMRIEEVETDRFYDVVLSHLCLQTVEDHHEFVDAMSRHVAPSGTLLLSIPHPCFYNGYKKFITEDAYQYMEESRHEISFAITLDSDRPIKGVPYFHRPLSCYVTAVLASGFSIHALAGCGKKVADWG